MDLFSLECFMAIAESGSFTKAALRVKRTQSAVTQQISSLEKLLNARLFNRDRCVSLTKEGELFLSYANRIYALHQEALDRFKNPELEGEVRFGVPEDFAALFLSDFLINFSRAHPRVFLSVDCDLTLNLFKKFKNGLLDLVLLKMSSPEDFPNGVEVWKEPLVWVGKSGITPSKDGSPLPLVLSPEPCVYRSRALSALDAENIPWRIVYTSPSYAGVLAAVKANMGVTALPITMIPKGLDAITSLPSLSDIHVSLLKQPNTCSSLIKTLEDFLLNKLISPKERLGTEKTDLVFLKS